jgi:hypothetical protein
VVEDALYLFCGCGYSNEQNIGLLCHDVKDILTVGQVMNYKNVAVFGAGAMGVGMMGSQIANFFHP